MIPRRVSVVISIAIAAPPAAFGLLALVDGDMLIGVGFLVIAAVMVALPEYVVRRLPGPRSIIQKRLLWRREDN